MKFCRDCKYIRISTTGLVPDVCLSPNLPLDLVTGSPVFTLCKDQRYSVKDPWGRVTCGAEASWFEQKITEDADLDDLSTIPFGK